MAARSGGGQRRYQRSVLRRLAFIRAASNVGLTLEEIRDELDRLPGARTPTRRTGSGSPDTGARGSTSQIAALEKLRDGLDSCIGCGCLSLQRCAISNPFDIAAMSKDAPGAVYLPAVLRRPHTTR